MAAAHGAMPGMAKKQRLKYDPIALRQPREPELSGWKKFLRFFIHERVREVDRRDRWWGLIVWFLVLVAYGIYLLYLIVSRFEQRQHPPVSVNVVEQNPLATQAKVGFYVKDRVFDWYFDVYLTTSYVTSKDEAWQTGLFRSSCPTCGGYSQDGFIWEWHFLTLTEAFNGAPDGVTKAQLYLDVYLSRRENVTINDSVPESVHLYVAHSCELREWDDISASGKCEKEKITFDGDSTLIMLSKTRTLYSLKLEADKHSELDRWQPSSSLPIWLTGARSKVHNQPKTWSYQLRSAEGDLPGEFAYDPDEMEDAVGAFISLLLPERITTYEEQEPFDVLTMLGVAAGTWSVFVFVITLLLPMRPSGRRRIWRCCWRLSARLLHQENKIWDAKRKNTIQHEMEGDIEEEMREVENQPGEVDIAELELPSMEDRMARTERVLRRLQNSRRPRKLNLRRLHQQRRQYKAQRQQKGRLFTAPLQQPHSSDEGSDTESDLEGSGGGGEVKQ